MVTSFAKENIEIMPEYQRRREHRVLQETRTTQPRGEIFELACEHCRGRGEGKG
jgi:hypothetical protein